MERKIFNSLESRSKRDLKFKLRYVWCLRSAISYCYSYCIAIVFSEGSVNDSHAELICGIAPTCSI